MGTAAVGLWVLAGALGSGPDASPRAGAESWTYRLDIGPDERRGPAPERTPARIKEETRPLLEQLRGDGKGLQPSTEANLETFFTVADAFEADGRLATAAEVLVDLRDRLAALQAARRGRPVPGSLIAAEEDLLPYRDSHNIHAISEHYLAGGQPSERGYRWLKAKGVTTVINLREPAAHEEEVLKRLGLRYVHIPWPDLQAPGPAQVRQIVRLVEEEKARGGKVFQHCLRGIGRDGTMVCCVRVAGGMTAERAIAEWLKVSPTWLDDQARDSQGVPVQLKAVRQFETTVKHAP